MELSIFDELRDRLNLPALGKPALIGLAAIIILVAAFAGKHLVEAATASDFEVVSEAGSAESGEAPAAQAPDTIFVHVSGAVKEPGLVELDAGSRVADAVQAAGGFAKSAATDSVNLARLLEDGEQLIVSEKSSEPEQARAGSATAFPTETQQTAQAGRAAGSDAASGQQAATVLVNINTAAQAELETLPGIGPSTAEKIVADRAANGAFSSVDDLMRVSGIGEKKLEDIRNLVCV